MQTLDISEVVSSKAASQAARVVSKPSTAPMALIGVSRQRFETARKEFETDGTADGAGFVRITDAVNNLIRTTKIAKNPELAQLQQAALQNLLVVVAAHLQDAHTTNENELMALVHDQAVQLGKLQTSDELRAADDAFAADQAREIDELQAKLQVREEEIARLVAQAHKPVLVDGKRKISLFCGRDGSISCRPE